MNNGRLSGKFGNIEYSHKSNGVSFCKTTISIKRLSGTEDIIPVIMPERLAKGRYCGDKACLIGEIRTKNVLGADRKRHLSVFFHVKSIEEYVKDENIKYENIITGDGFICKPPVFRVTPLNRKITDIVIANNRCYGFSDYIPSITWDRLAEEVAGYGVGTHIQYEGRLQSRSYSKIVGEENGETIEKIAYELSISGMEAV